MDDHSLKIAADAITGAAIVASIMQWLPPIAAVLGIVWYVLQIYGWFEKRRNKSKNYKRRVTDHRR